MKPLAMLKMPILLGAFGAALMFSPACKAQEVSPEQFEDRNTAPFENMQKTTAVAPKKEQTRSKAAASAVPARTRKAEPVQTAQLTPIREVSKQEGQNAAAVPDNRKTARKQKKQ
jgi:hypothetical protein